MTGPEIRLIRHGSAEFDLFADGLGKEIDREPEDFNAAEENADTFILGSFEGPRLEAFAIFRSFLDPTLHLGGMIDPAYLRSLRELGDVAIFNISLVRTIGSTENLGDHARLLIEEAQRLLLDRKEACCLLITLFKKANRKAFPLYRSLGFKRRGGISYYMDIDPAAVQARYGKTGRSVGNVTIKTFDEMGGDDMDGLARCYARVFVPDTDAPVSENLGRIVSRRVFLPELSVVLCDTSCGGQVVGFCFIERESDESVLIGAAGLLEEHRGGRISMSSFSWVMGNCLEHGYRRASLVTASKKLRYVFARAICARPRDSLLWFIKCGVRDE